MTCAKAAARPRPPTPPALPSSAATPTTAGMPCCRPPCLASRPTSSACSPSTSAPKQSLAQQVDEVTATTNYAAYRGVDDGSRHYTADLTIPAGSNGNVRVMMIGSVAERRIDPATRLRRAPCRRRERGPGLRAGAQRDLRVRPEHQGQVHRRPAARSSPAPAATPATASSACPRAPPSSASTRAGATMPRAARSATTPTRRAATR